MSRSGYTEEGNQWDLIRWRGAVKAALRGKRGQAFLKEMLAALEALPEKRLITEFIQKDGEVCALGAVTRMRGLHGPEINVEFEAGYHGEPEAEILGIAEAMAREIVYLNDEAWPARRETAEARWKRIHEWVKEQIR